MAYTTIDKSDDYFNTILWTGDGTSSRSITGVGFAPDMVWWKGRTTTYDHRLIDTLRTGTYPKLLYPNQNIAETEDANNAESIDSDGFTIGSGNAVNQSGQTYVAWNWLAGGTGVSNTDGSITSTVSANTTSGFSIVSWTGNGVDGASIGHGLVNPNLSIIKRRDASGHAWNVNGHPNTALFVNDGDTLNLNSTAALSNSTTKEIDLSTDSGTTCTFVDAGNDINLNGGSFIGYFFKNIKGYSKIGSYTGNGSSTDNTFVYTGFKPAFLMIKRTSSTSDWTLWDTARQDNEINKPLWANLTNAESAQTTVKLDLLSNGFKIRGNGTNVGASGSTYFYMAFAENPFVTSTGIPATAR